MAGTTVIHKAPYPTGDDSTVFVRMGGYVKNGLTGTVVDNFVFPWDCFVIECRLSYTKIGDDLDAMGLVTKDDSKSLVTAVNGGGSVDGTTITALNSDVANRAYVCQRGDAIICTADSTDGAEEGSFMWTIALLPIHG